MNRIALGLATIAVAATLTSAPTVASAQSNSEQSRHRQQTKNDWRNAAIASGILGAVGLVKHNDTLAIAGLAGAVYSASRYEHDRKSQSNIDRRRAATYGKKTVWMHGHRYVRKTVYTHGEKGYKFVRG